VGEAVGITVEIEEKNHKALIIALHPVGIIRIKKSQHLAPTTRLWQHLNFPSHEIRMQEEAVG
jgi:hypothetical protein